VDAVGDGADARVEPSELVLEPPSGGGGRDRGEPDLVGDDDDPVRCGAQGVAEQVGRRTGEPARRGEVVPQTGLVDQPGQPGAQAVDDDRALRTADDAGDVGRLEDAPSRWPRR
jgi:hypothetical protein